jgi:hypothetical protein
MSRRLMGMSMITAMGLMGCVSAPPAAGLARVERKVADLPKKRIAVQLNESGFVINNQDATFTDLRSKLGELRGVNIYCEIEKFAPIPDQQLEELASVVIRSGGRFFYRQARGAIDSLFFCTEFVESPARW